MTFLSQEQLIKVLLAFNPWWTSAYVPRELNKPVRRVAFDEIKNALLHPTIRRAVFLSGARRVGKTTLVYQLIADLLQHRANKNQILYISFDHPILKFFDMGEILSAFLNNIASQVNNELYLFFDEIHYADNWDTWLKIIYDQNPSYRIMVTGSASPLLENRASESGVGRWITLKIPTLSFFEYLELIQARDLPILQQNIQPAWLHNLTRKELADIMIRLSPLQSYFSRYLLIGGFPELVLSDDTVYAQRVLREDVADKVLKRDLTALFGTRNVIDLEKIFLFLCLYSGNIISQDTIASEVGVSRQTVSNYLSIMEQANLIYISNPLEIAGKKILKSRPKIYIADVALRNAVLLLDESVFSDPVEMGMMIETAVYKHVTSLYYASRPRIGYYRGRKNKEADIVVALPGGRIVIEVKYREDTTLGRDEAIIELANLDDTLGAVLVTKNIDDFGPADYNTRIPIVKMPAFAFLYLLGYAERQSQNGSLRK
ncbi:ATP-binding protein [Syntrophomonas palmitatica]|uniref:ATP-binding protein n=1 Tax=Syntrophomonas palmitatica TaxID=402877 RepID=UPI0006D11F33|nr:ATP-binding protein [Syntrophomonas palmitatica]